MALRRGIDSDSVTHVCKGRVFFFNWQTLCLTDAKVREAVARAEDVKSLYAGTLAFDY